MGSGNNDDSDNDNHNDNADKNKNTRRKQSKNPEIVPDDPKTTQKLCQDAPKQSGNNPKPVQVNFTLVQINFLIGVWVF